MYYSTEERTLVNPVGNGVRVSDRSFQVVHHIGKLRPLISGQSAWSTILCSIRLAEAPIDPKNIRRAQKVCMGLPEILGNVQ